MRTYIAKRILLMVPVVIVVCFVDFMLVRLVPGDAVALMLGETANVPPSTIELVRKQLGLDEPWHTQFLVWTWHTLQGDWGTSFWTKRPVIEEIFGRLPVSLELAALSVVVSLIVGMVAGIVAAIRQDTALDYVARSIGNVGQAVPNFWLGTLLILLPSLAFGYAPPIVYVPLAENPTRNLQQFIFPALTLGTSFAAVLMRMARSSLLEVLRQDYIRTAYSKGLRERQVIYRHALKNAQIPVVTLMGVQFGRILSGSIIVETIFNLPGLGRLAVDAIYQRDYPLVQGIVLFFAILFLLVNLAIDLCYGWLDPRIRYH